MRYPECQREDGDCEICSLSNYGRDCHNAPVNRIAYIRYTAGLTQQAMSDLLHIPKRTIENWEAGSRTPPDWTIELIEYRLKNEPRG